MLLWKTDRFRPCTPSPFKFETLGRVKGPVEYASTCIRAPEWQGSVVPPGVAVCAHVLGNTTADPICSSPDTQAQNAARLRGHMPLASDGHPGEGEREFRRLPGSEPTTRLLPTLIQEPSKKMGREVLLFRLDCIFCLKLHKPIRRSTRRDRPLSIAEKARIAAARPLAGTLSAGSLAAKALIAAARA